MSRHARSPAACPILSVTRSHRIQTKQPDNVLLYHDTTRLNRRITIAALSIRATRQWVPAYRVLEPRSPPDTTGRWGSLYLSKQLGLYGPRLLTATFLR
jgi:hypothetical protein